jgi:hypothetical protein
MVSSTSAPRICVVRTTSGHRPVTRSLFPPLPLWTNLECVERCDGDTPPRAGEAGAAVFAGITLVGAETHIDCDVVVCSIGHDEL